MAKRELTAAESHLRDKCISTIDDNIQALSQSSVDPELFKRVVLNAIVEQPELMKCQPAELMKAVRAACRDGLIPDGKQATIYPGNGKGGKKIAIYLPMVSGIFIAAKRVNKNIELRYDAVCENDKFEMTGGSDQRLIHQRPPLKDKRGGLVGAYCLLRTDKSKDWEITVLDSEELKKIRGASRAGDKGPWGTWPHQMAIKSVIKRALRFIAADDPQGKLGRIIDADNEEYDLTQNVSQVAQTESAPLKLQKPAAKTAVKTAPAAKGKKASAFDGADEGEVVEDGDDDAENYDESDMDL